MTTTHQPPSGSDLAPTPAPGLRPVLLLAAVALPAGWVLLSLALALELPLEPFVLLTTYGAMVVPVLLLTARESGRAGRSRLLRNAVRGPRPWWWWLVAALAIPALTWAPAYGLGRTEPLTGELVSGVAISFVTGLLLVNLAEEMVWMGFVQTRVMTRWGLVGGSLAAAGLFAGIHLPLALAGASSLSQVLTGVAGLFGASVVLRLVFGAVRVFSGPGLASIALMHATYNATGQLLQPGSDLLRLAAVVVLAAVLVPAAVLRSRSSRTVPRQHVDPEEQA